ncbi:MAG: glycosyltransferase family 9 protein [Desulfovibrionaceae bacterium]|nr:glycosyltransferase family 9 protein [Desulfovibrionaceae bacterium]
MSKHLVIQLARFGDIVQTKRLILSLQAQGEVHLCVDRSLQELACLVYPGLVVHGLPAHGCTGDEVFSSGHTVLEALRAERFDTVYALNHAGLCRAVAALFDPAVVRGYRVDSGQVLRSNWVRLAFRWMADRGAAPLNLVDFWAALAPAMIPGDQVNPPARPGGAGLGVVLSGRNPRRSLPPDYLAPVVHAVFERLGASRMVLLGASADRPAARRLLTALPSSLASAAVDLTGRTDWAGLADALTGLDALLSPDTGTAHLAAHLGVPVEGLFCSSAWAWETGPYGTGHRIWQTVAHCAPCVESSPCSRGAACRKAFTSPAFLARFQGRGSGAASRPLDGLIPLASGFDLLGQIWTPREGTDPFARRRAVLRGQLAEYLGLGIAGADSDAVNLLYREADWMLPQALP